MKHIAIFASGTGSNAENIIRYFLNHPAISVVLVISDRKEAPVLEKARKLGVAAFYFPSSAFLNGEHILTLLQRNQVELIVLAGFLKLVPKNLIDHFPKKIINIHPALLPKYGGKGMYGMQVHEAVYKNHETETGITIHYVNAFFDEGEIIFQAHIPLDIGEDPVAIQQKVHTLEIATFPMIIEQIMLKG